MNSDYLREFVTVAHHLSFSDAARELHVAQPTLSGHIAALEKELGADLFERVGSGVLLTPAGRRCVRDAHEILGALADMRQHARKLRNASFTKITVQTHASNRYLQGILIEAKAGLERENPCLALELADLPRVDLFADVLRGEADICIVLRTFRELPNGLAEFPVVHVPLAAFMAADSPLAQKESLTFEDLAPYDVVTPGTTDNHWYCEWLEDIFRQHGIDKTVGERYYHTTGDLFDKGFSDEVLIDTTLAIDNLSTLASENVAIVPMVGPSSTADGVCVVRADDSRPELQTVLDMIRTQLVRNNN